MSERRDGQRHYDTSNPCSEPITGVANEDARLREINADLLKVLKAVVADPNSVEPLQQAETAIAKAEETEEEENRP